MTVDRQGYFQVPDPRILAIWGSSGTLSALSSIHRGPVPPFRSVVFAGLSFEGQSPLSVRAEFEPYVVPAFT